VSATVPTGPVPTGPCRARGDPGRQRPFVSVLVPVFRPVPWHLDRCIRSVLGQEGVQLELCLFDDGSADPVCSGLLEDASGDPRVRVGSGPHAGISAATNAAAAMATGEWLAFVDQDDELVPGALSKVRSAVCAEPAAEVVYGDFAVVDEHGRPVARSYKPSFCPELLCSFPYLTHLVCVRRELFARLGGLRSRFDGAQDFDLHLRLAETASTFVRVPEVLYLQRMHDASTARGNPAKDGTDAAGIAALREALCRRGEPAEVERTPDATFALRRRLPPAETVAAVVVERARPGPGARLAAELAALRGGRSAERPAIEEVLLVGPAAVLAADDSQEDLALVRTPPRAGFGARANAAAACARASVLVLVGEDVAAGDACAEALLRLAAEAARASVGVATGRLVNPDRTLDQAGLVVGSGVVVGAPFRGTPEQVWRTVALPVARRSVSAAPPALFAVRREVLAGAGGFDETLPALLAAVELCLRLWAVGLRTVYVPEAELVRLGPEDAGDLASPNAVARFRRRFPERVAGEDPFFHPDLRPALVPLVPLPATVPATEEPRTEEP
jgi:GT2 family glycosyltransferase